MSNFYSLAFFAVLMIWLKFFPFTMEKLNVILLILYGSADIL